MKTLTDSEVSKVWYSTLVSALSKIIALLTLGIDWATGFLGLFEGISAAVGAAEAGGIVALLSVAYVVVELVQDFFAGRAAK